MLQSNFPLTFTVIKLQTSLLSICRSKEWVVLSRREDLLKKDAEYLYKNCRICAEHFEDMMFSNPLRNRLNPQAKPTLFNIPNPPAKIGVKRRATEKSVTSHSKGKLKNHWLLYYFSTANIHLIILYLQPRSPEWKGQTMVC